MGYLGSYRGALAGVYIGEDWPEYGPGTNQQAYLAERISMAVVTNSDRDGREAP